MSLGEWYTSISEKGLDESLFLPCNICKSLPKLWLFNNGRYVACGCFSRYEAKPRAESVMSIYTRCNKDMSSYKNNDIIEIWNKWVKTGIIKQLPEGQW